MSPGTRGSPKRYCNATCRRVAWAIRHLPPELRLRRVEPEDELRGVEQCMHTIEDGPLVWWCIGPPGHDGQHTYGGCAERPERDPALFRPGRPADPREKVKR